MPAVQLPEFSFGTPELRFFDKAIPAALSRALWDYSQNEATWEFKNRGSPRDPLTSWVADILNYSKSADMEETGQQWAALQDSMPAVHEAWAHIVDLFPGDRRIKRVFLNGHTFGLGDGIHDDGDGIQTFLLYLNPEWLPAWGGETMYYNEKKDEIVAAVLPKPRRLIMFDGRIPHAGRAPSRFYSGMRVTLAIHTVDAGDASTTTPDNYGVSG